MTCKNHHQAKRNKHGQCVQCVRDAVRRYKAEHPDRAAAQRKAWIDSGTGAKSIRNSQRRRKMLDVPPEPEPGTPCECCASPIKGVPRADHNHETGRFRGWLCPRCNTGLGYLERPGFVECARAYLERK